MAESDFYKLMFIAEMLSSSESSSDEDEVYYCKPKKKSKVTHFTVVINNYTDAEFRENLRLERSICLKLIEGFKNSDYFKKCNNRNGGKPTTSAEKHILCFLWFAGNKTVFRVVAQLFDISVSTFFLICDRVMKYLNSIAPEIIKYPKNQDELETLSTAFETISGFPNVVGCIDGTYINIRTPAHKIKSTYVNRHHQTALTLQGICDNRKRFIDVFTGVSSKMHDSRVFKLSFVSNTIPDKCGDTYHILGDAAYALAPYLITPYRDYGYLTQAQKKFNRIFSATRVLIENSFGLLKSRFRQLICLDFHTVLRSSMFIISCCVLHNMCMDEGDIWDEEFHEDLLEEPAYLNQRRDLLLHLGEDKRNRICDMLA